MKIESVRIVGVSSAARLLVGESNEVETIGGFSITLGWAGDIGFGEFTLRQDTDGSIELFTETLNKDVVREVFLKLVEDATVIE